MNEQNTVQELKAERVQEERVAEPVRKGLLFVDVADEPAWVNLKAERVQEPESLAAAGKAHFSSSFQLTVSQKQPITIELPDLGIVIKMHGAPADRSTPEDGSSADGVRQPQAA